MKMKASPGDGFTPPGVETITADDVGLAEIPEQFVDLARSHGFVDWVDPTPLPVKIKIVEVPVEKIVEVEKAEDPNAPPEPVEDEFEALSRNGLFAWLKARDISAPLPQKNESLRALARAAKAAQSPAH